MNIDLSEVQDYIKTLQGIINRLENNSFQSKGWVLTLTLALVVLRYYRPELDSYRFIFYLVIVFFCLYDAYYHGLAQHFKTKRDDFVEAAKRNDESYVKLIYKFGTTKKYEQLKGMKDNIFVKGVIPYYAVIAVLVFLFLRLLKV